jgi:hypothetical protein
MNRESEFVSLYTQADLDGFEVKKKEATRQHIHALHGDDR